MNVDGIIFAGLILINLFGFILVAVDKRRAKRSKWRISEKSFFLISALGGFPGVYSGLLVFRHKTRHIKFMIGLPLIFAMQLIIIFLFVNEFA
jgi:uncharacterized membrane protein YsdA (DUF1294 family)